MSLTNAQIKAAEPSSKLLKLADRDRLYVAIAPSGRKSWRWGYRLYDPQIGQQKQYEVTFGDFPGIDLKEARARRAKAAEYVDAGQHPPEHRSARKAAQKAATHAHMSTLWSACEAWIKHKRPSWSPAYAEQSESYLRRYCGPDTEIGSRPLSTITTPEVFALIEGIGQETPRVAALMKQRLDGVFRRAVSKGQCTVNPVAGIAVSDAIPERESRSSPPIPAPELHKLLRDIRGYRGARQTGILLELLFHLAVRTRELADADWSEFDFEDRAWTIPAERMKMRRIHIVPLSDEAITLLAELAALHGFDKPPTIGLLFKSRETDGNAVARATAREAMYRLTKHAYSPHSARSTFSTETNEADAAPHVVDAVLAHVSKRSRVEASYNRATYFGARRVLMADWSRYLSELPELEKPVTFRQWRGCESEDEESAD